MEQKLKERLIGTAVITALAVIFLPMLIDEEDHRWVQQEPVADVPPLPEKFKNKPKILSEAGVGDRQLFPATRKSPINPEISSISTGDRVEVKAAPVPEIRKPVLKKPVLKQNTPGMQQQLESLLPAAKQKGTQPVVNQTDSVQQPSSTQRQKPPVIKKPVVATKTPLVKQPSQVVAKVKKPASRATSTGKVTKHTQSGTQKHKKAVNSDLTGLWIVQAGVFKEKSNAEALRRKLSSNGFAAYLESVTTEVGELIRVRAGRVPEERAARQMVKTLNKRFALKSITFPETRYNSKRAGQ